MHYPKKGRRRGSVGLNDHLRLSWGDPGEVNMNSDHKITSPVDISCKVVSLLLGILSFDSMTPIVACKFERELLS